MVVTRCQENKSCSKILNFLERDDRIRCTHEETVAVVKPWKDIGSNKSLGCVFSEKPTDWTNAFKVEISSLADFYDVRLHGQFRVNHIHTPSFLCSPTYHHYKHPQPKSKYKAYVQFLMLEGGNVAQSRPKWKQGLTKYTKRENGIVICEKEGCSKLWEPEPRRVGDKSH